MYKWGRGLVVKRVANILLFVLYNLGMSYEHANFGLSAVPQIKKVGRPKKWETVEELEDQIQAYFASCFIVKTERQRVAVPPPDCECDKNLECKCPKAYEYLDVPLKDEAGNVLLQQIQPFTVTDLAIALDTTRETLLDYEKKPENAQFSDAIKKAKQIVLAFNERRLHSSNQVTGVIFNLKNNFGYVDRVENLNANVEVDGDKVQTKVDSMFDIDEDN